MLWLQPQKTKITYAFLVYICCMFTLSTLFMAFNSLITQYTFIDDRNFPGGPSAYAVDEFNIPPSLAGNTAGIMGTWFADALLVRISSYE